MQPRVAVVPFVEMFSAAAIEGGAVAVEAADADALVWSNPMDAEGLRDLLQASPARWIQLPFAGIERFFDAGVVTPDRTWTCAKGIYGPATAEHALALLLDGARLLHEHARRTSWWPHDRPNESRRLAGRTVLIVGTGGIGRALAAMLQPLGPRVIAVNRSGEPMPGAVLTGTQDALPDLVPDADFIVLAPALTAATRHLVDAELLKRMKPEAWIVNVGRGPLVDTDALVDAVRARSIAGAGLDVTDPEPLPDGHPLWTMDNVIITSHSANTARMAMPELAAMIRENVVRFARGEELIGLVDPALGY
ncbi:MAG TPA: D-isomer specific 2-hydroxyacid dehydrogenase family protein [Actinomycetota bacterium]|nr:D-isomer specific 2-hydroxyacid dehydrogenase family protein [Actinomycetota bacterium]